MEELPTQRSGAEPEPSLAGLRSLRHAARLLYRREAASICDYVHEPDARTVVAREELVDEEALGLPVDPTQHATCTCFVVAHLTEPGSLRTRPGSAGSTGAQFLGRHTRAVIETVRDDFVAQYRVLDGAAFATTKVRLAKDTWELPNWYNTPLHLSGLAAAIRSTGGPLAAPAELMALGTKVATRVAAWLDEHGGYVPDIGLDQATRNPYLTYWCVRSLTDWTDLVGDESASFDGTLRIALEASLDYLARILVANQAGIGSIYDAPDMVCSLSVVALASRRLRQQDEYIAAVLPHAFDVLLDAYVHRDGSFAPNTPVLETRHRRRVITASSEELNAILVHALGDDLAPRQLVRLRAALDHADRKSSGPRGWGYSAKGSPDRRDAFVAAGALAFLRGCLDALDRAIAQRCERDLGVSPYVPDPQLDGFAFPYSVATVIEDRIIKLIEQQRRDLAIMSLVLAGPRSTPKELIARKTAQRLRWPIAVFDPASFVREGNGPSASEVGRVVDLVSELSDTVVFFDGFDDADGPNGSRPISRSLLDKLDRVGERRKILLIIGSTRPSQDWFTADWSGHVDNVFTVLPPNDDERRMLLARFLDRFGAKSDVVAAFEAARVVEGTHGFNEGFLQELVRTCVSLKLLQGAIDADEVERERQAMVQRLDREEASSL